MSEENKLKAIQEELTVAPKELSEQELNEIAGGGNTTKDEETTRDA
jgi:bacteriocin-like protein